MFGAILKGAWLMFVGSIAAVIAEAVAGRSTTAEVFSIVGGVLIGLTIMHWIEQEL